MKSLLEKKWQSAAMVYVRVSQKNSSYISGGKGKAAVLVVGRCDVRIEQSAVDEKQPSARFEKMA